MNPPPVDPRADATAEEIHTELFVQLVTGHAQIAMMFLGKYPNPQSGQFETAQPEVAKLYIDQLEMLEAKTRGNLAAAESAILKQMLGVSRNAFAEVIDAQLGATNRPTNPPQGN